MNVLIEKVIRTLAERAIQEGTDADHALKYTQAAANIANAYACWCANFRTDDD